MTWPILRATTRPAQYAPAAPQAPEPIVIVVHHEYLPMVQPQASAPRRKRRRKPARVKRAARSLGRFERVVLWAMAIGLGAPLVAAFWIGMIRAALR